MASVPCSFSFTSPCFNFSKSNRTQLPSSTGSVKSLLGSSNSGFLQHGFALKAGIFSGFSLDSPKSEFGVFATAATGKSIYDFTVKDIDRKDVPLSKFKDKVLLIVNVASQCGLTSSNYSELTQIYNKYKDQGLEILAFPCNQFGFQEPGSNNQIKQFACTRFKAEFPIFDKVDVNGPFTAPIYQFLKSSSRGFLGDLVKWNFEKFLVDKNGKVAERYPPTTSPLQIERDIKKLLAA
ncbi:putative phospholipid hydroperoxide glutathione peroxidase [Bidens hawaiensis]|uniref:putative phospholipid hydroperoxide glutathione peroxidase n=1 Tax=Bidens hawaiensis TaxID=980011 RepID=UPI00404B9E39